MFLEYRIESMQSVPYFIEYILWLGSIVLSDNLISSFLQKRSYFIGTSQKVQIWSPSVAFVAFIGIKDRNFVYLVYEVVRFNDILHLVSKLIACILADEVWNYQIPVLFEFIQMFLT